MRLTYADLLERFPEETNRRIELIDGELLMPPAPNPEVLGPGDTLSSSVLAGFSAPVEELLK